VISAISGRLHPTALYQSISGRAARFDWKVQAFGMVFGTLSGLTFNLRGTAEFNDCSAGLFDTPLRKPDDYGDLQSLQMIAI
jgi:hypothetical protein